jgi:hypothetical protein
MYTILTLCIVQLIKQYVAFVCLNNRRSSAYQWGNFLRCLFVPINHSREQKPELRFHNNITKETLCPTAKSDAAECREVGEPPSSGGALSWPADICSINTGPTQHLHFDICRDSFSKRDADWWLYPRDETRRKFMNIRNNHSVEQGSPW